jgi:hypothetical protein
MSSEWIAPAPQLHLLLDDTIDRFTKSEQSILVSENSGKD